MSSAPTPVIPDAGVYGAQTAAATNAYNNAVAQATAQRNALYHSYGLNNDATVDPNNPGGAYQMLLKGQADRYQADEDNAQQRGLGGRGLGAQQESNDRAGDVGQDFQFQSEVANVGSDYENALQDALSNKNNAITAAYNDALAQALQNQINSISQGYYDAPGTGEQYNPPTTGKGQSTHAVKVAQQHHNRNHQKKLPPRGGRPMRAA